LKNKFGYSKYCIIIALISNIFKPLRNMKKVTTPKTPIIKPTQTNNRTNLTLGKKLRERALNYSDFSGLSIPALLRNGLDMLLKQNNF